jgi:holliday junction DNA helicase RuvB
VQAVSVADFTLIGATTDPHGLILPLADRFKLVLNLQYLSTDELAEVVRQRCAALQWRIEDTVIPLIAQRAKGTPRTALKLLEAARRCCRAEGANTVTLEHFTRACELEQVDTLGLDSVQQQYLGLLADGPCRLNVLASLLGLAPRTISSVVEPFLQRAGLVVKLDSGKRSLTKRGYDGCSPAEARGSGVFQRSGAGRWSW